MSTVLHSLYSIPGQTAPWAGWAYILLAILVAVEGPVITLAGAVAASTGYLNPILVFIAAAIGNLIADTLWYSLGYLGKIEWLLRYGGKLGIKETTLARLQTDVHDHIRKILFIAKLTLGFVVPTLIAAGLAGRWVPFDLPGHQNFYTTSPLYIMIRGLGLSDSLVKTQRVEKDRLFVAYNDSLKVLVNTPK